MTVIDRIRAKAAEQIRTIVFPEGNEPRTIRAAVILQKENLARPVLLGDPEEIRAAAEELGADISGIEIIHPAESRKKAEYTKALYEIRKGSEEHTV